MIHIIVTTYVPEDKPDRGLYLFQTVRAMGFWTDASTDSMRFLVVDDGSKTTEHLDSIPSKNWRKPVEVLLSDHGGIGHSLNRALEHVRPDDLWLYMTDDWVRTGALNLIKAEALIRLEGYDYVRLGPIHPNLKCTTRFNQRTGWWLELHPEYEGYAFGTRPFLASRRFYDLMGPFKERCDAYVCERDYSDRVAVEFVSVHGMKMAAVVDDGLEGQWNHIGEIEVGDTYVK